MNAPLSPFYKTRDLIFISGQVGIDPSTHKIPEDFESQAKNTFENLKLVVESAGLQKRSIVKTTVYMTDLSLFGRMNDMYVEFFGDHKPARTTLGIAALPQFPGDPAIFIEIDAVATL